MPSVCSKRPWRGRLYGRAWSVARKQHLARHPLCVMCQGAGRITAATIVDHVRPHRGDSALFWARDNWQSLCQPHHDGLKQALERGSVVPHDAKGYSADW